MNAKTAKQAKPVATVGKEGVDGSSRSEGFRKFLLIKKLRAARGLGFGYPLDGVKPAEVDRLERE